MTTPTLIATMLGIVGVGSVVGAAVFLLLSRVVDRSELSFFLLESARRLNLHRLPLIRRWTQRWSMLAWSVSVEEVEIERAALERLATGLPLA